MYKQVREATNDTQEPWFWYNASLEDSLYLAGVVPYVPPVSGQKAEAPSDPNQAEIVYWE